jgi:four helix bundle protein
MADQLLRSATACPPNYAEARSGESLRNFVHQLGIVRKELNESLVWIRIIERRHMVSGEAVEPLLVECDELCRIIAASRKTAEANSRQERKA